MVLRSRLVKGDEDDTTVKMRPVEPNKVTDRWRQVDGFKVEADRTGDQVVCSASMSAVHDRQDIDRVTDGSQPIEQIFSKQQVLFLGEFSPFPLDFSRLVPLGPIRVLRWKTKHKGFAHELTTEEWRLPDGEDLLEVSIKVTPDQAASAQSDFYDHLKSLGLDPAGAQATKTRTALEFFAKNLTTAGSA